jgi:hypothetical protein
MSMLFTWLASKVGEMLFLPEPGSLLDDEKRAVFEQACHSMFERPLGNTLNYDCPYPKWEFLRYLVHYKDIVLHGSNLRDIKVLEPRNQTDYSGKPITAVFASRDGIWPIFFAIVNRNDYRGSVRNGCWVVSRSGWERRFYFFSVNEEMFSKELWVEGTIYILPGEDFELTNKGIVRFDEWANVGVARPIAKLAVKPEDFPFLDRVTGHQEGESILRSWFMFKKRSSKGTGRTRI